MSSTYPLGPLDAKNNTVVVGYAGNLLVYQQFHPSSVEPSVVSFPVNQEGTTIILAVAIDSSAKYVAVSTEDKLVSIVQLDNLNNISTTKSERKVTALKWKGKDVILADRNGKVSRWIVETNTVEHLLGHCSQISCFIFSRDQKFLLTGDRDAKLRISHYPDCFDIQSFCLGQRKFTAGLIIPSGDQTLVLSGSGDGWLRVWDYMSGSLKTSLKLQSEDQWVLPIDLETSNGSFLVIASKLASVSLYRLDTSDASIKLLDTVDSEIYPLFAVPIAGGDVILAGTGLRMLSVHEDKLLLKDKVVNIDRIINNLKIGNENQQKLHLELLYRNDMYKQKSSKANFSNDNND